MKYYIIPILLVIQFYFIICNDKVKSEIKINEIDTNRVYEPYFLDQEPKFPGGNDSLRRFISHHAIKPKFQADYIGVICVSFIIDRNGIIQKVDVKGDPESSLFSDSFKELFEAMPKWKPGMIKKIKVKTRICLPFRYALK